MEKLCFILSKIIIYRTYYILSNIRKTNFTSVSSGQETEYQKSAWCKILRQKSKKKCSMFMFQYLKKVLLYQVLFGYLREIKALSII